MQARNRTCNPWFWRPLVYPPLWRPPLYAPRRGPMADATAYERRLRGDGFGDGFGADFSPLGRSTGGDSAPVLTSVALSEVGSPGSLRQRVGGSSPSSGAPPRCHRINLLRVHNRLDCARGFSYRGAVRATRRSVRRPCPRDEQRRRLGCNRWRSRGRDRTPNLDGDSPKPSYFQEVPQKRPSVPQKHPVME